MLADVSVCWLGCCCTSEKFQTGRHPAEALQAQCYHKPKYNHQFLNQRKIRAPRRDKPELLRGIGRDCSAAVLSPCASAYKVDELEGIVDGKIETELGRNPDVPFCGGNGLCTFLLFCFNFILLLASFLALAVICDDFLVPPIEHFCATYNIPDEVSLR